MNKQLFAAIAIILGAALAQPVHAAETAISDDSAKPFIAQAITDGRVTRLTQYLESLQSPMAGDAAHFVSEADRLGLDWKLVAAIAGVESTFGKHVPANSYNGWGWGIFTGQSDGIHFSDWKNGITTVSEGLKRNYVDKGAVTVEDIGAIYAASPTWSMKVRYFLRQIDEFRSTKITHLEVTI